MVVLEEVVLSYERGTPGLLFGVMVYHHCWHVRGESPFVWDLMRKH